MSSAIRFFAVLFKRNPHCCAVCIVKHVGKQKILQPTLSPLASANKAKSTTAMLIYADIYTGDELFSDSYKIEDFNKAVTKVESKMVSKKGEEDFGIGNNADPEEAEQGGDAAASGDNAPVDQIIENFHYNQTFFDKKDFLAYIKGFMGKLKGQLEKSKSKQEVDDFVAGASAFVKDIGTNFTDYEFYFGEQNDIDNGVLIYRKFGADGMTPYFYYFKVCIIFLLCL